MLNRCVLVGRLTRDPELRYTQSGKSVCSFSLAVDRPYRDADGQKQTDFINITVWGKQGENCANYLAKGKLAAVDGRIEQHSYEKNGQKVVSAVVVADAVAFLSPRDQSVTPDYSEGGPF